MSETSRPESVVPAAGAMPEMAGMPETAGGMPEMAGMPDMSELLGQAMKMQEQLMAAQHHAATQTLTGVAGGGVVQIDVTGSMAFSAVRIDRSVVDPTDVSMLEDLVLAAIHDATGQVAALNQQAMSGLGLGDALGGLLG